MLNICKNTIVRLDSMIDEMADKMVGYVSPKHYVGKHNNGGYKVVCRDIETGNLSVEGYFTDVFVYREVLCGIYFDNDNGLFHELSGQVIPVMYIEVLMAGCLFVI